MAGNETIRWGIIGCGNVTEVKSGPAFGLVPGSALQAVMRRDAAKAADYAQRHNVPKWYSDAYELINDAEIDAIYVATPPGAHEEYAIAAMRAGKPVYVEKPMAVNVAACGRMQRVSEETGVKLCVAHYRRALPMFLHVKELLASEAIGEVRTVRISLLQTPQTDIIANSETNWRVDPAIAGAGLFYDLAPHQLDLVRYFFGAPFDVAGNSAHQAGLYAAEDAVTGIMRLPQNILFTGQWCYTVSPALREDLFEITGSAGRISFAVFDHSVTVKTESGTGVKNFIPPKHIQQPMIEKVVNYFSGAGPNPSPADEAIDTMRVMEMFAYGKADKSKP